MIKIYNKLKQKEFWDGYWLQRCISPDIITNYTYYPFTLLKKYLLKNLKIIEVGCGSGRVLKGLHNEGFDVFGFDNSVVALRNINKNQERRYHIFAGDVIDLAIKPAQFDIGLCFGVISCIEKKDEIDMALKGLKLILKNNSILIISLLNYNILRRLQRYIGILRGLCNKKFFYGWAGSIEELENILSAEFNIIEKLPSITRQVFFDYIPFFRKRNILEIKNASRDDREYQLNFIGEWIFQFFETNFPYVICGSVTFVCKKLNCLDERS